MTFAFFNMLVLNFHYFKIIKQLGTVSIFSVSQTSLSFTTKTPGFYFALSHHVFAFKQQQHKKYRF